MRDENVLDRYADIAKYLNERDKQPALIYFRKELEGKSLKSNQSAKLQPLKHLLKSNLHGYSSNSSLSQSIKGTESNTSLGNSIKAQSQTTHVDIGDIVIYPKKKKAPAIKPRKYKSFAIMKSNQIQLPVIKINDDFVVGIQKHTGEFKLPSIKESDAIYRVEPVESPKLRDRSTYKNTLKDQVYASTYSFYEKERNEKSKKEYSSQMLFERIAFPKKAKSSTMHLARNAQPERPKSTAEFDTSLTESKPSLLGTKSKLVISISQRKLAPTQMDKRNTILRFQKLVRRLINSLAFIKSLSGFLSQPVQGGWEYDSIQMITDNSTFGKSKVSEKANNIVQSLSISVKKTFAKSTHFKFGLNPIVREIFKKKPEFRTASDLDVLQTFSSSMKCMRKYSLHVIQFDIR